MAEGGASLIVEWLDAGLQEQARQALAHFQEEVSAEQREQARQGLTKGDVSVAEQLFRQALQVSGNKEKAAEAVVRSW